MDYTRGDAKAWANQTLKGFYEAPFTPIGTDLEIDEAQLKDNIERYIDAGVDGLVVGGFIAELWTMTYQDWLRYHAMCAQAVAGRVPLFTIILESSVKQALEKMAYVEKLGYQGAEVMNPSVQLRGDDEIFDYFKYLTDHSDLAVVLYRTPMPGTLMSLDLCVRLAELETVVGVKQGSFSRADTLTLRRRARDDFIVSEPFETFFFDDMRFGGQVLWAAFWYLAYGNKRHLMRQYYEHALAGEWEQGFAVWQELQPIRHFFEDLAADMARTGTYASHIALMKPWMEAIGFPVGPVLPPVREADPQRKAWLVDQLQQLGVA
ncbi:MAG: dihydrodipicolinate synthase family protein [Pseudomonadota bacterium]|nr:dihydrodipicolinate synthase family protein [Pseudomonadota bacterium]